MNELKHNIEQQFCFCDVALERIAGEASMTYERRAGPGIGRALLLRADSMRRGVYIELKDPRRETDPADPGVDVGYGAWYQPAGEGFPLHFHSKRFYSGPLSGLKNCLEQVVWKAISELKVVTVETVKKHGQLFEGFPQQTGE